MTLADAPVELRGGVSVALAAYWLALDFEARGIRAWREGDCLIVEPADRLTDDDREIIRRHKPDLLVLLDYLARPDLDAHLFTDRPEAVHA